MKLNNNSIPTAPTKTIQFTASIFGANWLRVFTSAVGTMEIKLAKGQLRVTGSVDAEAPRTVLEVFARMLRA
jgi:hypothetical protein